MSWKPETYCALKDCDITLYLQQAFLYNPKRKQVLLSYKVSQGLNPIKTLSKVHDLLLSSKIKTPCLCPIEQIH